MAEGGITYRGAPIVVGVWLLAPVLSESPLPGIASVWTVWGAQALAAPLCALRPCMASGAVPCVARLCEHSLWGQAKAWESNWGALRLQGKAGWPSGQGLGFFRSDTMGRPRDCPSPAVGCHAWDLPSRKIN